METIDKTNDVVYKLPDYNIEQFWLQFKTSMHNFYSNNNIPARNIIKWSDTLNALQKQNSYNLIEKHIMDYITCYGLDIIKSGLGYHLSILHTNINRWNKLSSEHKIFTNTKYKNLFYTCIEISYYLYKSHIDFKEVFEDIEIIVINNNIENILKVAINNNKQAIIDKLLEYDKYLVLDTIANMNIKSNINTQYIDIKTLTSKTILKLFQS